MISRRALFGLSVGAVVTARAVPVKAEPVMIGLDFGKKPAAIMVLRPMPGRTLAWQLANPEKMAEYRKRFELERGCT